VPLIWSAYFTEGIHVLFIVCLGLSGKDGSKGDKGDRGEPGPPGTVMATDIGGTVNAVQPVKGEKGAVGPSVSKS